MERNRKATVEGGHLYFCSPWDGDVGNGLLRILLINGRCKWMPGENERIEWISSAVATSTRKLQLEMYI